MTGQVCSRQGMNFCRIHTATLSWEHLSATTWMLSRSDCPTVCAICISHDVETVRWEKVYPPALQWGISQHLCFSTRPNDTQYKLRLFKARWTVLEWKRRVTRFVTNSQIWGSDLQNLEFILIVIKTKWSTLKRNTFFFFQTHLQVLSAAGAAPEGTLVPW